MVLDSVSVAQEARIWCYKHNNYLLKYEESSVSLRETLPRTGVVIGAVRMSAGEAKTHRQAGGK